MLPAEEDPASLVAAGRQQEFIDAVSASKDGLSWWLDAIASEADAKGPLGRTKAATRAASIVENAQDAAVRQTVLVEIGRYFGVDPATLSAASQGRAPVSTSLPEDVQAPKLSAEDSARIDLLAKAALAPNELLEATTELETIPDPSILQMLSRIADIAQSGSISGKEVIEQLMTEGGLHELLVEVAARLTRPAAEGRLSPAAELRNAVLFYKRAMLKKQFRELSASLDTSKGYVEQVQTLRREINKVETAMQEMQRL
jgi:hypothetical protein